MNRVITLVCTLGIVLSFCACSKPQPPESPAPSAAPQVPDSSAAAKSAAPQVADSPAAAKSPAPQASDSPAAAKSAAPDPALAEAMADIARRWGEVKSLRATIDAQLMSPPGATYQFIMKGGGHYEYQRSADVGRARMEVTLEPSAGPGAPALAPGTSISPITTLYVFDGAHVFQQDKSGEPAVDPSAGKPKITVHRGTIDDVGPFSVSGVIGADALQPLLDKGMQLRRLPDGTVDDKPAYIIEMAGPPEANQPVGDSKQKLYYDKDTGICVKIEHFLRGDSPLVSMTFRNIEVNPAIDRARFVYTVPNEAEVREMRPPPPGGPPQ